MNEQEEIMNINKLQAALIFKLMIGIAIICSAIMLALKLFRFHIIDMLSPFIAPLVDIIGYLIFFSSTLLVLIYYVFSKTNPTKRAIPLMINVIVWLFTLVIPFQSIILDWDFRYHQSEREAIVTMLLDGTLNTSDRVVSLPEQYKKLSKGGGEIIVIEDDKEMQVLFFTYRGVTDNYSGFIYTMNGAKPEERDFGQFLEMKKLDKHWYWVSAT